jgi:hypothetical protein
VDFPNDGTRTLDETLTLIAAQPQVWVRIGASLREDGKWYARLAEFTSGGAPVGWTPIEWSYPQALFAASLISGDALCQWVRGAEASVAGKQVVLPTPYGQNSWEREQSQAPTGFERLPWPMAGTTLAMVDNRSDPSGHLVSAEDAPSFMRFYNGAASFFTLGEVRGGSLPQSIVYRHQDQIGRIVSVRVADEEVKVVVEGPEIGGMIVELAGDSPGPVDRIPGSHNGSHAAAFALTGGLPAGAWVLLRRGSDWVDRRYLARSWMTTSEAGVEFADGRTRLDALVADREGQRVEFKREVPKEVAGLMKSVCAFANGDGGSVLFGVDDELGVPGIQEGSIGRIRDQLQQLVDSWVQPTPKITFDALPTDLPGKSVLEMRVESGGHLFGSRANASTNDFTPYIRHNAISVRARLHEIEQIVRSRPGSDPGNRYGLR